MFPALNASTQCFDRLWILEEVTQRTRRAAGFHADDATRVGDADEDVFVGLEDREQTLCFPGDQVLGSYP